jgi:hypothetical protein
MAAQIHPVGNTEDLRDISPTLPKESKEIKLDALQYCQIKKIKCT